MDTFLWCIKLVPVGEFIIFNMIEIKLLIVIELVFVLSAIVVKIDANYFARNEHEFFKKIFNTYLYNISLLSGNSLPYLPRTKRIRNIVTLLFVFNMVLNIYFNTYLTSFITHPPYHKRYKKVMDLYEDKFDLYFIGMMKHLLINQFLTNVYTKNLKLISCPYGTKVVHCIKNLVKYEKCAMTLTYSILDLVFERDYKQYLNCFSKEPILQISSSMFMQRGFLYNDEFNRITKQLFENGLIKKWNQDGTIIFKQMTAKTNLIKARESNYFEEHFKYDQIAGMIWFYIFLQCCSLAGFIIEWIVYLYYNKR